jgi:prepilin-type N-terminal cleavage/methylation domain-containing protein
MGDRPVPRRTHAFTLVELLVVIVIISALAAIIFPVITKARGRAAETACISNLRQIGAAFRMYMQDNDEARPRQLCVIVPGYLTTPELLVCKQDPSSSYAYKTWGYLTAPNSWPYPQSYDYFQPIDSWWEFLEGRGSRSGYLFDRCHGEAIGKTAVNGVPNLSGHTLRVNMDGSVVTREIHYPLANTMLNTWFLMNYNPGENVPEMPK